MNVGSQQNEWTWVQMRKGLLRVKTGIPVRVPSVRFPALAALRELPDVLAQRAAVSRHYLLLFKSVEFGAQMAQ
jgi:hypothetical protein